MGERHFLIWLHSVKSSHNLSLQGGIVLIWSLWLPNFFIAGLTGYFWQRMARNLPISLAFAHKAIFSKPFPPGFGKDE